MSITGLKWPSTEDGRGLVTERYAPVCKSRDGSFPVELKLYLKGKGVRTLGRKQVCPARLVLTWINVPIASRVEIMSRASVTEDAAFPST